MIIISPIFINSRYLFAVPTGSLKTSKDYFSDMNLFYDLIGPFVNPFLEFFENLYNHLSDCCPWLSMLDYQNQLN